MNDYNRDVRQLGGEAYAPQAAPAHAPQHWQQPAPSMRPAPAEYGQPGPVSPPAQFAPPVPPAPPQEPLGSAPAAVAAAHGQPAPSVPEGVVELSKAYRAHDADVKRIRIRPPITKDIRNIGNPVKIKLTGDGKIDDLDIKWDRIAAYVVALSDPPLPPSTVDQFSFEDLDACAGIIAPFFVR